MVKVVLDTTHLGIYGGGENYLMRLSMALDKISDFSTVSNWPEQFKENNGFYQSFQRFTGLFRPDIFIYCSHFNSVYPIGKRNFVVTFFPKPSLRPNSLWDGCISICNYTAKFVKSYWNFDSTVIYPCIDPSCYINGKKSRKIVSIGHFFEESDGHSKNQHIIADAIRNTPELKDYELVFIGNANQGDDKYVRKVREAAKGINCRIEVNRDGAFLRQELSTASHLISANGAGRIDPSQCEHFGIIFLEALASGVVPIAHKSGGYAEIDGVIGWEQPEEIGRAIIENTKSTSLQQQFVVEYFNQRVEEWLNNVNMAL